MRNEDKQTERSIIVLSPHAFLIYLYLFGARGESFIYSFSTKGKSLIPKLENIQTLKQMNNLYEVDSILNNRETNSGLDKTHIKVTKMCTKSSFSFQMLINNVRYTHKHEIQKRDLPTSKRQNTS